MKFDAAICLRTFPSEGETGVDRDVARNRLFGPLLGSDRVMSRAIMIGELSLVTRLGDYSSLLYPKDDPRHPAYRHEWFHAVPDGDSFKAGVSAPPETLGTGGVFLGVAKE